MRTRSSGRRLPRLGMERLEERHLMATFAVSSLDDAGAGTLRQAILDANALAGADEIDLSAVAGTIALTSGEFAISEAISIVGPGDELLTIDAQQASRIFNANFVKGDVSIAGLALINGKTTADDQSGGAVYTSMVGNLTFTDCTLRGNVTEGKRSTGGAIRSLWHVFLVDCLVENNHTLGDDADGGGVSARGTQASLTRTTVVGNYTAGYSAPGGGVWALSLLNLVDSNVKQNRTKGEASDGGGVRAGTLAMTNSSLFQNGTEGAAARGGGANANSATISSSSILENFTLGHSSTGGGLHAATFFITDSFVLDNTTNSDFAAGGGIGGGGTTTSTITRSTISGNRTMGASSPGGGVRSGRLTMINTTVSNNSTQGDRSSGGGLRSDITTTLVDSLVIGNSIEGNLSYGGGVFLQGTATITGSTISNNKTMGNRGFGGGVTTTGTLGMERSTVHGNRTAGTDSNGGGIHALGALTLRTSTVSGNSTSGDNADGGGLIGFGGITLDESTVSGNWTTGVESSGGGIASNASTTIRRSTVANNRVDDLNSFGGGVRSFGGDLTITGSIVAGNQAVLARDVLANGTIFANWSLIEESLQPIVGSNNIIGVPAGLLPLANNGGPTMTHALAPGSLALDAGDPLVAAPPAYDQRGFAFARIVGGRIDMGAFEAGGASADFDRDGRVDGDDFLLWQRGLGGLASHSAGDANVDGVINGSDLNVWRDQHGSTAVTAAVASTSSFAMTAESTTAVGTASKSALRGARASAELVDAALANFGGLMETSNWAGEVAGRLRTGRRLFWVGALAIALCGWQSSEASGATTSAGTKILPPSDVHAFGGGLALDGNILAVGAARPGRQVTFVYENLNGQWLQVAELNAIDVQPMGRQVVSLDETTILVGDPDQHLGSIRSAGTAYIFEKSAGGWLQAQELRASTPLVDAFFGGAVAVSGTMAIIGSGKGVYVFEKQVGTWMSQGTLAPSLPDGFGLDGDFGGHVALDGDVALVSASSQDAIVNDGGTIRRLINSGAVFAYERDGTGWHETDVLAPSDPVWRGSFGYAMDMSGDTAIIGRPAGGPAADGPFRGAAYVFEKVGSDWIETAKLEPSDGYPDDGFGSNVAISGNFAAVLATEGAAGRVYLFAKQGSSWNEIGRLGTGAAFSTDQYGIAMAMDGGRLAVGAPAAQSTGVVFVAQVPEPAAWATLLPGLAWLRRRRG